MKGQAVDKSTSDSAVVTKTPSHKKAVSNDRLEFSKLQNQSESSVQSRESSEPPVDKTTGSSIDHHFSSSGLEMEHSKTPKEIPTKEGMMTEKLIQQDLRQRKSHLSSPASFLNKEKQKTLMKCDQPSLNETSKNQKPIDTQTEEIFKGKNEEKGKDCTRNATKDSRTYYLCWMILTLLSLLTRLYDIEIPPHVW